jgi:hypothetical protein
MKTALVGLTGAFALFTSGGAVAADAQLMAPIQQFIDSFNKGDVKAAEAAHDSAAMSIIDEVPPYVWQGPGAFKAWAAALEADAKRRGHTDQSVKLGESSREEVTGDRAYVVVPATFTFKEKGAAMAEQAQMAFALARGASGWKISGWSWTGPRPSPAN